MQIILFEEITFCATLANTQEMSYSCEICESLIGHAQTHTEEKPFSCEVCGSFSKKLSLVKHIQTLESSLLL